MPPPATKPQRRSQLQSPPEVFELEISAQSEAGRSLIPYLRGHLRAAYSHLKNPPHELSISLVGDATMSRLHATHLKFAGPTDVLTFEIDHDSRRRVISGEVIICLPQARRQAKSTATSDLKREVLLLALHGLLHLSGFDDKTPGGFAQMHNAEDRILSTLGVGPVFEAGRGLQSAKAPQKASTPRSAGVRR